MVNKLVLKGLINTNTYFINSEDECLIVDPGYYDQIDKIKEYIKKNNFKVKGILLTHAHLDHTGAIGCFDVPLYMHKDDYNMLCDTSINGYDKYEMKMEYNPNEIDIKFVEDRDIIKLNKKEIKVIHTPGHSAGGLCFLDGDMLYSGDTLFDGMVGIWDYDGGCAKDIKTSIIKLLDNLDGKTKVYPGHYNSTTIGHERKNNEYYLRWKNILK